MCAVITGSPYPNSLYTRGIARIRADQEVTSLRAALLKACLNRAKRLNALSDKNMPREVAPSRGRGLKLHRRVDHGRAEPSPPARGRGLKCTVCSGS